MSTPAIVAAHTPEHLSDVREIFREYQAFLNVDICFRDFEKELTELPGIYAPPRGMVLLSMRDEEVLGSVALCPINDDLCEMKRLYVRPAFRGTGMGRTLAEHAITDASAIGYRRIGLDTLGFLTAAIQLYKSLGFAEASPYYDDPRENVLYWELKLDSAAPN